MSLQFSPFHSGHGKGTYIWNLTNDREAAVRQIINAVEHRKVFESVTDWEEINKIEEDFNLVLIAHGGSTDTSSFSISSGKTKVTTREEVMTAVNKSGRSVGIYAVVCFGAKFSSSTGPLLDKSNDGTVSWEASEFGVLEAAAAIEWLKSSLSQN